MRRIHRTHSRRKTEYRLSAFLLALGLFCLTLSGCGQKEQQETATIGESNADGTYEIYYINKDSTSILAKAYKPETSTSEALIDELVQRLSTPVEDIAYQPPLTDFSVKDRSMDNGVLTVDLTGGYHMLDATKEILVRAAIVDTLCQVPGVKSVIFTVEGKPLTDESGNPLGGMTPDKFVVNLGKDINSYEKTRLVLYFADESGDKLVPVGRTVVYNSNISREKLVVEELMKGPNGDGIFPTINPDAKLIGVTSRDGVCYVNFDKAFLDEPYKIKAETAIYSLVDSLTEIAGISRVQISIDGDTSQTFMESMPLQTLYERNLTITE
jgi:germination protein M